MIDIIVAFCSKNFGIGKDGTLPWFIPEDLVHFKKVTDDSIVVMGRKTWDSIPSDKKPLKNRKNIIVTSKPNEYESTDHAQFVSFDDLNQIINEVDTAKKVFIIGGHSLYSKYMGVADRIHATVIDNVVETDTFFPIDQFHKYEIEQYSPQYDSNGTKYRFITYKKNDGNEHDEKHYLSNMQKILTFGNVRDDRTGTGTISIFGPQLTFDISRSIPLLTTKFVGIKSIIKELLFFLRGETDSRILEKQNVNIWKANTTREFLDRRGLKDYEEGDMGPMYGFNWRHFTAEYKGCRHNYDGEGFDQVKELINGLKNDPYSRRHMLTTYNPADVCKSVLAPCHGIVTQFYVEDINGKKHISCQVYCRSQDTFLGQPYNIASYTVLTYIIGKICNMYPKQLILTCGDCHIYKTHLEQVKTQLSRAPLPFPVLEVDSSVEYKNIDDITVDDFTIIGYLYHPAIKAEMAV